MDGYDFREVEERWQRRWDEDGTYRVGLDDPRPPYYVLSMYPYPSGPAHQGHIRNYTFGDVLVRHRTMQGHAVLSPFGFDSFGLPAENAAIKGGDHPRVYTEARISELKASVRRLGAVYDWRRELRSHDPDYMRWNQVIFLELLRAGLAYRAEAPVNWCPGCHTVLANEQVLADGTCERSGDIVERRNLEQWFFRITDYAEELLDALDGLDWPERVKTMQRNWIGRSEGAQFRMAVAGRPEIEVEVFTTRPDTSFGMTYAVLAPEHPLVVELVTEPQREAVAELSARAQQETDIERQSSEGSLEKRGAFTGSYCVNPFNDELVPIYVADYVLMGYGTGAIMAVPAEDERDFAFAEAYGLPIVRTVEPPEDFAGGAYAGDGAKINSGFLNGLDVPAAKRAAIEFLEERGIGRAQGPLPVAGLVDQSTALLGLPDPRCLLPHPRHGTRAGRRAADPPARERRIPPDGRVAPALRRGLLEHDLPDLRWPGQSRDGHDGHLRGLGVVLPALLQPAGRDGPGRHPGRPALHACRPVHRRHHPRDLALALRPFLHKGSGGHRSRPEGGQGALLAAVLPGDDPSRRPGDVEVPGQRRVTRRIFRKGRSRRAAAAPLVHRTARRRRRLERADRGDPRRMRRGTWAGCGALPPIHPSRPGTGATAARATAARAAAAKS